MLQEFFQAVFLVHAASQVASRQSLTGCSQRRPPAWRGSLWPETNRVTWACACPIAPTQAVTGRASARSRCEGAIKLARLVRGLGIRPLDGTGVGNIGRDRGPR